MGCAGVGDFSAGSNEIALSPTVDVTRALPVTSSSLTSLDVYAVRSATGTPYFSDRATRRDDGIFRFPTIYYWLPGAAIDFYAITPSECVSNVAVAGGAIDFDYAAISDGADVLAGFAFGQTYGGGAMPLRLNHTLAMVEFAVAYSEDADGGRKALIDDEIEILSLALYGLASNGHCSVSSRTVGWTHSDIKEWTVQDFTDSSGNGLVVGKDLMAGDYINDAVRTKAFVVVPGQTLTSFRITFIEGRPKPYTTVVDIAPLAIEPGKHYVFNLAIKSDYVSLSGTRVTDWVSSNSTDVSLQ